MKSIQDVINVLENAPRMGAEKDIPEGTRYIQVSATLADLMVAVLKDKSSAVETLREARHYAMRVGRIAKVHVTIDFYQRLVADKDYGSIAPIYDVGRVTAEGPMPLFGCPCQVHFEPCEKPFWFEGEDGKEIVVVREYEGLTK